jgi:hypothetical protein
MPGSRAIFARRLKWAAAWLATAFLLLPVSLVITWLLKPAWNAFEASTGIESMGHSGPATWCYFAVHATLLAVSAVAVGFLRARRGGRASDLGGGGGGTPQPSRVRPVATRPDDATRWPFDQPKNCATFTTRQVIEGREPIVFVSHDAEDHSWQFIGTSGAAMADAMIVGMGEVVNRDPTLVELAGLPPGWQATRTYVGGPWTRQESPPVPQDER